MALTDPVLLAQWDRGQNGDLTPDDVTYGSRRKVWWRCEKGHAWQAMPAARSAGESCPVCAGKVVIPGENDLATLYPEIAAQWDGEKNGELTAEMVSAYSNRKAWWRCEKGHSWQAPVAARTKRRSRCPYCMGRKVLAGYNDLATVEPFVAMQWHPALNGDLTPEQVTAGSRRYVWWRCSLGHVWRARVHSRTGNQRCGCPVCAGRTKAASRDPPVLAS